MLIPPLARPGRGDDVSVADLRDVRDGRDVPSGMRAVPVPLRDDFSLDAEAFIARMQAEKPALVFLAFRTTRRVCFTRKRMWRDHPGVPGPGGGGRGLPRVCRQDFMPRLAEFDNLVVIRTVSKLGLAGIRLGYLVGRPEWMAQVQQGAPPYNVNVLTQAAALFMLERLDVLEEQAARIQVDRGGPRAGLRALKGRHRVSVGGQLLPVRVPDADGTYEALSSRACWCATSTPGIRNCLRVTVGTPDENRILLTPCAKRWPKGR